MLSQLCICALLLLPLLGMSLSCCRAQNVDFSLKNFSGGDILLSGNCSVGGGGFLQLTVNASDPEENAARDLVSRAVYASLVEFYDEGSGAEASFNTSFTFRMKSVPGNYMGDGMTFIIAPSPRVPRDGSGDALGLYDSAYPPGDPRIQVLAVEFDTFSNKGDPVNDSNHVGLDINNVVSVKTQNLSVYGIELNNYDADAPSLSAWIDYSAARQELVVYMALAGAQKANASLVLSYSGLNVSSIVQPHSYVGFTASTGFYIQDNYVYDWSFSTSGLPQAPSPLPQAPTEAQAGKKSSKGSSTGLVAGVTVGALLLVVALGCGLGWFFCCRSGGSSRKNGLEHLRALMMADKAPTSSTGRSSEPSGPTSIDDVDVSYGTRFTYQELKKATLGFSQSLILGKGGFGSVYRGVIRNGDSEVELAIKRISQDSRQGEKEFLAELKSLGQLRHRNLVHLHGWCHERDQLLLVYEYMPNLSLDRHLYSSEQVLSWAERFLIIQGIAAALVYIHTEWKKCILHRDIKPSNVMLDENMEGRLGDFGLARLVEGTFTTGLTLTGLAGTKGYMAPELAFAGKATPKSDVFSFGVLSLEVACGRRPQIPDQEIQLVEWVWQMHEAGTLLDVADPAMDGKFDAGQLTCVLHVGLLCTHPDPTLRPSTRRMQQILNGDVELPPLPRSRPVATYGFDL